MLPGFHPPIPGGEPGRSHLGRAGGGGVARRCSRGRRWRAARRPRAPGPEAGLRAALLPPVAAASPRPLPVPWRGRRRRRQRQVGPICSHTPGGGRVRRRASLPAASPLLSACVDRLPSRLRGDSPPPRPGSAVLVCLQPSSFSSLEFLRPLHLEEDWGGFTEHHRCFGHPAFKLS